MNTKQLLKTIDNSSAGLRESLLRANKAALAMNRAKSSSAAEKARNSTTKYLGIVQIAAEKLESAHYDLGMILINDLKRKELDAENKKVAKDLATAQKAADKRAVKDQIKGLSKSDLALAKKYKMLGRSPAGAAALTKDELKRELVKLKADLASKKRAAKSAKGSKKTKAAKTVAKKSLSRQVAEGIFPPAAPRARQVYQDGTSQVADASKQMITMSPAAKEKLLLNVVDKAGKPKTAKVDRKKEPNRASARKAAKKSSAKKPADPGVTAAEMVPLGQDGGVIANHMHHQQS